MRSFTGRSLPCRSPRRDGSGRLIAMQLDMVNLDLAVTLEVVSGAVAALTALAWAGGGRLLGWPRLAGMAAGLGLLAGLTALFGIANLSPRQWVERLPVLALIGLAAGLVAEGGRTRRVAGSLLGLLAGAWWMAGAPQHPDALMHVAPVALGLLAAMALALRGGAAAAPMAMAWLALAAGVAAAGVRGPYLACALAGVGGILGAALVGMGQGMAARLPLAVTLAGIAAGPVLARAAPANVAVAAAPALALLAGPAVGRRLPARLAPWLGPALAALPAVAAALLLR